MMRSLSYEEYAALSRNGGLIPVYREIPADLLTPVSAFLGVAGRSQQAFLLESVVGGERIARYSFLGRDPVAIVETDGRATRVVDAEGNRLVPEDFLSALRSRLGRAAVEVEGLPRFTGGAVGYLTYDAIRLFERIPDRHERGEIPLARFAFYRSIVAFDHVRQRLILIANAEPASRPAFDAAQQVLDALEMDLSAAARAPRRAHAHDGQVGLGDATAFQASVDQAKEYIGIGDIFQVVLSRRTEVECPHDPFTVYRALRMVNPSPYMYFVKEADGAIAGSSPEILVRVEGRRAETRPIAGTKPRGATPAADAALEKELLADEKERAEHLMLVDLGRNDLGRVCRFGSVHVPEFMQVERYSHVMHIESSVVGELRPDKDALDALVATFPAGTLSGAPKIRAMEIIDELEPVRRGLYGGALGYLDLRGNLDFCIAIRTVVMNDGRATVQAGAGIVADSNPVAETRETEAKAGAVFAALELAKELGS
jgi:anthranilate synthase component 1